MRATNNSGPTVHTYARTHTQICTSDTIIKQEYFLLFMHNLSPLSHIFALFQHISSLAELLHYDIMKDNMLD